MTTPELLRILAFFAAMTWSAIGVWLVVRLGCRSAFERAMCGFAFLTGTWAFLQGVIMTLGSDTVGHLLAAVQASLAVVAALLLLLATKWIQSGHGRADGLLIVPAFVSFAIAWGSLHEPVEGFDEPARFVHDPLLFSLFLGPILGYVGAACVRFIRFHVVLRELPRPMRRWILATIGGLFGIVAIGGIAAFTVNLQGLDPLPFLPVLLVAPGVVLLAAALPLPRNEFSTLLRAVAKLDRNVVAVYLLHRSGTPIAAVSSGRNYPVEPETLHGVIDTVGGFVDRSMNGDPRPGATLLRFDGMGVVAVRGLHLIAAALYHGRPYDILQGELARIVSAFEASHATALESWEGAAHCAEHAADQLAGLLSPAPSAAGHGLREARSRDASPQA